LAPLLSLADLVCLIPYEHNPGYHDRALSDGERDVALRLGGVPPLYATAKDGTGHCRHPVLGERDDESASGRHNVGYWRGKKVRISDRSIMPSVGQNALVCQVQTSRNSTPCC